MQDPSHSMEIAEPEENGRSDTADSSVVDASTSTSDIDPTTGSTALVEVLPGVAVVAGEVPPELKSDLIDFGIVPAADRQQISAILASIGNAATVVGTLGNAFAGVQGLYRIDATSQALLNSGATLAAKDGGNLGAVMVRGRVVHQARFYSVNAVSKAQTAASIGPALAMVGLQMMLSEVSGLVRTNLAVTSQVLTTIRKDQWAELTGLVAAIDRAVDQAREIESVPRSLWEDVAGSGALLQKQLELYEGNVRDHIRQIDRADARSRREYLQTNAEAIAFDAYALLSSLKAWTGYHALRAARARAAGREDAAEAQYAEVIARDTRAEFDSALAESTSLVDALTRELRITAELPGPDAWPMPGKRKDVKAARETSARLLKAIEPLADALHPPAPPLKAPEIVCAPESLDLKPYLRILRWFLEDGEAYVSSASPTSSMPSVPFLRSSAARRRSWRQSGSVTDDEPHRGPIGQDSVGEVAVRPPRRRSENHSLDREWGLRMPGEPRWRPTGSDSSSSTGSGYIRPLRQHTRNRRNTSSTPSPR
ncbi:hypothetical protein [Streptomyces qinglanensis]|uniref:hypothetical protein n=1 Tax=Streptomyces qinglanensis TaxID=943816 RepID=UPI003D7305F9